MPYQNTNCAQTCALCATARAQARPRTSSIIVGSDANKTSTFDLLALVRLEPGAVVDASAQQVACLDEPRNQTLRLEDCLAEPAASNGCMEVNPMPIRLNSVFIESHSACVTPFAASAGGKLALKLVLPQSLMSQPIASGGCLTLNAPSIMTFFAVMAFALKQPIKAY
eukprot:TRINITY_DN66664_c0_g1_i1.p1 TRINITY_DN66664_c0_g1~~TRINITY_DN66664_c0_g1_i1.p1  ORF type:complete len:168 (-),score=17.76 TRINITY_DN66664_c0_g1_i1:38-541(-)